MPHVRLHTFACWPGSMLVAKFKAWFAASVLIGNTNTCYWLLTYCTLNSVDCFTCNSHLTQILIDTIFNTLCGSNPWLTSDFLSPLYPHPFNNPFFLQKYWSVSREQSRDILISWENILNLSYQQWSIQHICDMWNAKLENHYGTFATMFYPKSVTLLNRCSRSERIETRPLSFLSDEFDNVLRVMQSESVSPSCSMRLNDFGNVFINES